MANTYFYYDFVGFFEFNFFNLRFAIFYPTSVTFFLELPLKLYT